jgi:pyruvate, orthophosphate dikinase
MKSKALEVNLTDTKVHVVIEEKYNALLEIVNDYIGILKKMESFLVELCHPYKNWDFIVSEARHLSLQYYYLYKSHSNGKQALYLFSDIFFETFSSASNVNTRINAVDNLMLFLQHIIKESESNLETFLPVIEKATKQIAGFKDDDFYLFVRSYYQINRLAVLLVKPMEGNATLVTSINELLKKYYEYSFAYWKKEPDPLGWIDDELGEMSSNKRTKNILENLSRNKMEAYERKLHKLCSSIKMDSKDLTVSMLEIPGYSDIVRTFQEMPVRLKADTDDASLGDYYSLMFLCYIIQLSGLSMIHEKALLDIKTSLTRLIRTREYHENLRLLDKTFALLKPYTGQYPETVLDFVLSVGKAVFKTGEVELINYFIDKLIDLGFQFPMIQGTGDDWQIKGNTAHVKNIRVFFELIGQHPKMSVRLLSALIIYLSIGDVFIKDTDLFPRDISKFLNTDIGPVFNLVKQLSRLLPAFFNDIGAEGKLRDISTRLDEACLRKDKLIHFLRKQSHVESSSRVVDFIEEVILFWKSKDKENLRPFVPPSIFKEIESTGEYVDGLGNILNELDRAGFSHPKDFLLRKQEDLDELIDKNESVTDLDKFRIKMCISFYRLLNQKYNFDNLELKNYLTQIGRGKLPDTKELLESFAKSSRKTRISSLLNYVEKLKDLILSDMVFAADESIYHKRHFAVDIPSMYGSYNEVKFDALGLMLRIENILNVYFEELVADINLSLITKATFSEIFAILLLFRRALKADGLISNKMDIQLDFLRYSMEIRKCSYTQYLDIFKGFSKAVADIINDQFHNIHSDNIKNIESRIGKNQFKNKFIPTGEKVGRKFDQRVAEIFFRDRIATSLGLQQLDIFLNRILHTLFRQSEKLAKKDLDTLLSYNPNFAVTEIAGTEPLGNNIIFLGNKGLNIIKMKDIGFKLPRGFIITTEVFRCREMIGSYKPATQNFRKNVFKHLSSLEKSTKRRFGDPKNPLLLSVRSGSSISQPGMLDSFLNVGINEDIVQNIGHLTKNQWFAWDNYRRFLQGYGMAGGIKRDEFDAVMEFFKEKYNKEYKKLFTGKEMKEVALSYKTRLLESGIELVESPVEQLFYAINLVFSSWDSDKARDFRRIMGISDNWGTAVIVQSMVFGNMSRQSGSGVVFSHSPRLPGDTIRLWGDFTIGNQGEDVVSGLVRTLPISEIQREIEKRDTKLSLETAFPEVYAGLKQIIYQLIYDEEWNPQEIEFTFQGPEKKDLYLLQTRDMSLRERKKITTFSSGEQSLKKAYLGRGIGLAGGAISGRLVFTLEEIDSFRKADPKMPLILVRNDTVPDDILEIDASDGILTARGGVTSHAAVVAYNLGKTCVVGCENLICSEKEKECRLNDIKLRSGDYISINGQEGSVYKGLMKINRFS